MKHLNIIKKTGLNTFIFTADTTVDVIMSKTAMGWNIEVYNIEDNNTTFLWVADNAREAVKDCHHAIRFVERRRAMGVCVGVRKWSR